MVKYAILKVRKKCLHFSLYPSTASTLFLHSSLLVRYSPLNINLLSSMFTFLFLASKKYFEFSPSKQTKCSLDSEIGWLVSQMPSGKYSWISLFLTFSLGSVFWALGLICFGVLREMSFYGTLNPFLSWWWRLKLSSDKTLDI